MHCSRICRSNREQRCPCTCRLARLFPDQLILGMEIRSKVAEYVERKVKALRKEHTEQGGPHAYQNVSVVRANTMKYLCNFFNKGQLEKLLFLFPDPHFKAANHRCSPPRLSTPTRMNCTPPGPPPAA